MDPDEIGRTRQRLKDKLVSNVGRFSYYEESRKEGADTLLITYGVTARAARDLLHDQKSDSKPFSLLVLKTLWPVPESLIWEKARAVKRVVVVEMNLGQYVREVKRVLPDKPVEFFGQMDGKLITPGQIKEVIDHV